MGANESRQHKRLFLALYPGLDQRQQLHDVVVRQIPDLLVEQYKPVPIANLHMTLLFLGRANPDVQACIESVSAQVAMSPVTITLDRLSFWPRKRMLWVTPDPDNLPKSLILLVESLGDVLSGCEVPLEQQQYRPHVTLARKLTRSPGNCRIQPVCWTLDHFALMESVSTPAGVRYPVVKSWSLR